MTDLTCDNMGATPTCPGEVTHLDQKGFVYCTPCGLTRRQYQPCRKLRPHEVRKLQRGDQITRY